MLSSLDAWQVMKTLARKCSRARFYSPEVLQKEYVRAAFECVDWDDTEEVTTLFYMAKDLVQGRRKDSISCRCEHIRDRKGEV